MNFSLLYFVVAMHQRSMLSNDLRYEELCCPWLVLFLLDGFIGRMTILVLGMCIVLSVGMLSSMNLKHQEHVPVYFQVAIIKLLAINPKVSFLCFELLIHQHWQSSASALCQLNLLCSTATMTFPFNCWMLT